MTGRSSGRSSFHATGKRGSHTVGITWFNPYRSQGIVDRDLGPGKRHSVCLVAFPGPRGQPGERYGQLSPALSLASLQIASRERPENLLD